MGVLLWRVCGGGEQGGILVRQSAGLNAKLLEDRLATDALIQEIGRRGTRVHYRLLKGDGPLRGWVSARIEDRDLLVSAEEYREIDPKNCAVHEEALKAKVFEAADLESGEHVAPSFQQSWNALERNLFFSSDGKFDPTTLAGLRRSAPTGQPNGRVSVVTPTSEKRSKFHEQLWTCFLLQTWPDKELIVIETGRRQSSAPSFFRDIAQRHRNVVYVCLSKHYSIGVKRNLGMYLASGDLIVNFDDDDIYAPSYIASMVAELKSKRLTALTLSCWHDYDTRLGGCGFVDPQALNDIDLVPHLQNDPDAPMRRLRDEAVEGAVYGYGFSYVHMRDVALQHPYPDTSSGEDLPFMLKLRDVGKVGLLRDTTGLCLHLMHGGNTANSVMHRPVAPEQLSALEVAQLKMVEPLLEKCRLLEGGGSIAGGKFYVRAHSETTMREMQVGEKGYLMRMNAQGGIGSFTASTKTQSFLGGRIR